MIICSVPGEKTIQRDFANFNEKHKLGDFNAEKSTIQ